MGVLISRNEYKIEVKSFHPKMVYRGDGQVADVGDLFHDGVGRGAAGSGSAGSWAGAVFRGSAGEGGGGGWALAVGGRGGDAGGCADDRGGDRAACGGGGGL